MILSILRTDERCLQKISIVRINVECQKYSNDDEAPPKAKRLISWVCHFTTKIDEVYEVAMPAWTYSQVYRGKHKRLENLRSRLLTNVTGFLKKRSRVKLAWNRSSVTISHPNIVRLYEVYEEEDKASCHGTRYCCNSRVHATKVSERRACKIIFQLLPLYRIFMKTNTYLGYKAGQCVT